MTVDFRKSRVLQGDESWVVHLRSFLGREEARVWGKAFVLNISPMYVFITVFWVGLKFFLWAFARNYAPNKCNSLFTNYFFSATFLTSFSGLKAQGSTFTGGGFFSSADGVAMKREW